MVDGVGEPLRSFVGGLDAEMDAAGPLGSDGGAHAEPASAAPSDAPLSAFAGALMLPGLQTPEQIERFVANLDPSGDAADDLVRHIVAAQPRETLAALPLATRQRMTWALMDGALTGDDLDAFRRILAATPRSERAALAGTAMAELDHLTGEGEHWDTRCVDDLVRLLTTELTSGDLASLAPKARRDMVDALCDGLSRDDEAALARIVAAAPGEGLLGRGIDALGGITADRADDLAATVIRALDPAQVAALSPEERLLSARALADGTPTPPEARAVGRLLAGAAGPAEVDALLRGALAEVKPDLADDLLRGAVRALRPDELSQLGLSEARAEQVVRALASGNLEEQDAHAVARVLAAAPAAQRAGLARAALSAAPDVTHPLVDDLARGIVGALSDGDLRALPESTRRDVIASLLDGTVGSDDGVALARLVRTARGDDGAALVRRVLTKAGEDLSDDVGRALVAALSPEDLARLDLPRADLVHALADGNLEEDDVTALVRLIGSAPAPDRAALVDRALASARLDEDRADELARDLVSPAVLSGDALAGLGVEAKQRLLTALVAGSRSTLETADLDAAARVLASSPGQRARLVDHALGGALPGTGRATLAHAIVGDAGRPGWLGAEEIAQLSDASREALSNALGDDAWHRGAREGLAAPSPELAALTPAAREERARAVARGPLGTGPLSTDAIGELQAVVRAAPAAERPGLVAAAIASLPGIEAERADDLARGLIAVAEPSVLSALPEDSQRRLVAALLHGEPHAEDCAALRKLVGASPLPLADAVRALPVDGRFSDEVAGAIVSGLPPERLRALDPATRDHLIGTLLDGELEADDAAALVAMASADASIAERILTDPKLDADDEAADELSRGLASALSPERLRGLSAEAQRALVGGLVGGQWAYLADGDIDALDRVLRAVAPERRRELTDHLFLDALHWRRPRLERVARLLVGDGRAPGLLDDAQLGALHPFTRKTLGDLLYDPVDGAARARILDASSREERALLEAPRVKVSEPYIPDEDWYSAKPTGLARLAAEETRRSDATRWVGGIGHIPDEAGERVTDEVVEHPAGKDVPWDPYAFMPTLLFRDFEDSFPIDPAFRGADWSADHYDHGYVGGPQTPAVGARVQRVEEGGKTYYAFKYDYHFVDNKIEGFQHEGDWATITVYTTFDEETGSFEPAYVYNSWHHGGGVTSWRDLTLDADGRPRFYVEQGSHAVNPVTGDVSDEYGHVSMGADGVRVDGEAIDVPLLVLSTQGNVKGAQHVEVGDRATAIDRRRRKNLFVNGQSERVYVPERILFYAHLADAGGVR